MNRNIIVVQNLKKTFGAKKILCDINFSIKEGSTVCIVGSSGSGKSVLMKCIIGLIIPDEGSVVLLKGNDVAKQHISERPEIGIKCSMLFQSNALFDSLTIFENIVFSISDESMTLEEKREVAINTLPTVDLSEDILDLYPSDMSGGMQKRVALARALVSKPDILFLDEPTSGLDPITAKTIHGLIASIKKALPITIIIVTHDVKCITTVADEVITVENNTIGTHCDIESVNKTSSNFLMKIFS